MQDKNTSRRALLRGGAGALALAGLGAAGTSNASAAPAYDPFDPSTWMPPAFKTKNGRVFLVAQGAEGKPYRIDPKNTKVGTGPNEFDCSGLVMWSAGKLGIKMPHWTEDQIRCKALKPVSGFMMLGNIQNAAQYGDLVYFYDSHGITQHVGFAMTHGNIFSASSSAGKVCVKYAKQFPYPKARLFRFV